MISFLKKLFRRSLSTQKSGTLGNEPKLAFSKSATSKPVHKFQADADVHKLMIRATRIRKEEGYPPAIQFLQDLAEHYLKDHNTALVACINKLIPYMKRNENLKDEEIRTYLEDYIERAPDTDPYFLNLHITMAELMKSFEHKKAITYLTHFLKEKGSNINTYNHQIFLAELYIEIDLVNEAKLILQTARELLLDNKLERTDHIKKERKWHRTCAKLNFSLPGEICKSKYIHHRFMEFSLDMARALDPMQIGHFQERKDLYYKQERGFSKDENYLKAISELGLDETKDNLLRDIYGFCFEEMPAILGVSKNQFNYKPGDAESLEELQVKKRFYKKPFTEINTLENRVNKIIKNYMKWGGNDNC